jgi:two-component system chemotaxis sensor kinase CheA
MSTLDDAEIIAAARAGFLDEAVDMLHQFEAALLVMESTPEDADNLNAAFRAAHTIKGTAGLFGCDAVVSFTHEVETLLEGLRSGQLQVTEPIAAALLQGRDQMQALIDEVRTGDTDPDVAARSMRWAPSCAPCMAWAPRPCPAVATDQPHGARAGAGAWHLSLRFGADALRNGLDPLAFVRYLGQVGQVQSCHTLADAIPALERLDPEACCLGFEIRCTPNGRAATSRTCSSSRSTTAACASCRPTPPARCSPRCWPSAAPTTRTPAPNCCRCGWPRACRWTRPRRQPAAPVAAVAPAPAPERRQAGTDRRSGGRDRRGTEETRFVKVRADKLDHLIDLIGELVIAGSGAQMVANPKARRPSWKPPSVSATWCRPRATARWRCAWCRWARPSAASSAWCATPASNWARRSSSSSPAATPSSTSRWSRPSPTR